MEKTQATPAWKTPLAFPILSQLRLRDKVVRQNTRILGAGHYDALNNRVQSVANGTNSLCAYNLSNQRASIWDGGKRVVWLSITHNSYTK